MTKGLGFKKSFGGLRLRSIDSDSVPGESKIIFFLILGSDFSQQKCRNPQLFSQKNGRHKNGR